MVVKKDKADKFSTADGIKGAMLIAEKGSAGEEVAQSDEYFKETQYIGADTQSKALMEVKAGTSDIAVIDYVMAKGSLREGSDYSDLTILESKNFEPEEYGVAFRKGSDMTQKVNEAMQKVADNGKLKEIADKYNLTDLLKLQVK
jgi:polar amino acid transport system substrate-binding protein